MGADLYISSDIELLHKRLIPLFEGAVKERTLGNTNLQAKR